MLLRIVLAIVAQNKWKIFHVDVKFSFLNGFTEEEVYVKQPKGYEIDGQEDTIYKLKKSLYTLKQTPRVWCSRIDEYLNNNGFIRSQSEPTLLQR